MISLIRTAVISVGVTLVLSIAIGGRPLFYHVYAVISPGTIFVQQTAEDMAGAAFASVKKFTLDVFDNSVPKVRDTVRIKLSAPAIPRKSAAKNLVDAPQELIEVQEKQQLDALIKSHR